MRNVIENYTQNMDINKLKIGVLLFEQFLGKKEVGSSRLRGHWIVKKWKELNPDIGECEIFRYGVNI